MAERRRVLFVTPCTISGYAGNIARFQQTIALLSRDHDVEFLSLVEPTARHAVKLASWGARPCSLAPMLQGALRLAYKGVYILNRLLVERGPASAYRFGAFDLIGRALLALVPQRHRYDLVFTNYVWTARPLAGAGASTVIDLHDIHANRHERLGAKVWVTLRPEDERRRIEEADVSFAIAWAEYQTLRARHGDSRVRFMPYWPTEKARPGRHREPVALFLGSANQVNADALDNLRRSGVVEILVKLGARIRVCGAVCGTPQAKALQQRFPRAVELLGVVDDLANVLNSATLGINMSGPSTGLKIKTVDYLHAGLKVIATIHGSDPWLDRTCPQHLMILPDRPLSDLEQVRVEDWLASALAEPTASPPAGPGEDAQRCWDRALRAPVGAAPQRTCAMTPPPRIALLMATYGRDNPTHLAEALAGITRQTYPHRLMRLLLAIDGPIPDSNRQVIADFQARCDIETELNEIPSNGGLARALNAAAAKLSADEAYVLRIDADDLCHPDRVLEQVTQLEADRSIGILGSAIEEFESSGPTLGVRTYPRRDRVRDYIVKASPLAHPTVCFRRIAWDALGGYRDVAFNEDLDMWFRALAMGLVIDNLDKPLLRYRISEGFYYRRSWRKAFAEYRCYTSGLYRLFGVSWRLAVPAARLALRLMPRAVVRAVYSGSSWRRRMLNV